MPGRRKMRTTSVQNSFFSNAYSICIITRCTFWFVEWWSRMEVRKVILDWWLQFFRNEVFKQFWDWWKQWKGSLWCQLMLGVIWFFNMMICATLKTVCISFRRRKVRDQHHYGFPGQLFRDTGTGFIISWRLFGINISRNFQWRWRVCWLVLIDIRLLVRCLTEYRMTETNCLVQLFLFFFGTQCLFLPLSEVYELNYLVAFHKQ